jgi:signal transduction histidine kinase
MSGSILLLIHNIGFSISVAAGIAGGLFFFLNNKRSIMNIMASLTFLAAVVFIVSHIIGVNISAPLLSSDVLMFNLSIFFIGVFNVHAVLGFLNKARDRRYVLALLYASGLSMVIFFLIYPDLFLLPSVPKMYFPDYYNPGLLNWTRLAFLYGVCLTFMITELFIAYRSSDNIQKQNQIKYFIIALVCAYGTGFTPNFLVYNIYIDPLWGMTFLLFAGILLIYDSLKYEFMNVKIIAKQALGYLVLIEIIGVFISLLIFFIDYIRQTFPDMPIWILPIVLAIVFVLIGAGIWRRLSETDVLKYEFITVITHKFRTPLTRIKWAAEDIAGDVPLQKKENINTILESERQILAMTDTLVHLSAANVSNFDYHPSPINIESLFQDLSNQYGVRAERKGIDLSFSTTPGMFIMVDAEKSSFIFQILLDNALSYTPAGGSIAVRACPDPNGRRGTIEVTDTGIGMSQETASRVFKRFYRGANARRADTEGMGIGLFMAKSIAEKQNGKISVKSEGEGKGSTFSIRLPLYKKSA